MLGMRNYHSLSDVQEELIPCTFGELLVLCFFEVTDCHFEQYPAKGTPSQGIYCEAVVMKDFILKTCFFVFSQFVFVCEMLKFCSFPGQ
jgi:hypothetical protein